MTAFFLALLLIVVLMMGWLLTLVGMPGNWLMVTATAVYAYFVPTESAAAVGWPVVLAILVLAIFGEIIELVAGAFGTARAGGSRRGAVFALLGSIIGSIVGFVVGLPIPLIGSIVAAVLFAGLGAMAGAILGEQSAGRDADHSWRIGQAAFWGRLAGTLGKVLAGGMIVAVVLIALAIQLFYTSRFFSST